MAWCAPAWEELQASLPKQQKAQAPWMFAECSPKGLSPLRALRQGLLTHWPLSVRRPATSEDILTCPSAASTETQAQLVPLKRALKPPDLSRLLPSSISSVLLNRREERWFLEQLGGEVHTFAAEEDLRLHLLKPPKLPGQQERPGCMILFHGGSWMVGSPSQFYQHAEVIAKDLGVAVACCQYRLWLKHPRADVPFDAIKDAQRCVRFLHDEADVLGLDRRRFVVGGLSAGGHLAAMTALESGAEIGLAGLVLLNPVLDLSFSAGWRRRKPLIWLGSTLLRARYGEEALQSKSPIHQVRNLPFPTLILHGEEDDVIPLAQSEVFVAEMQRSHNDCKMIAFPQVNHHFLHAKPEVAERHLLALGSFLQEAGVMHGSAGDYKCKQ
ncbi:aqdA1 [Symbiodinium pilosum]|uniref:AqdA1 protein n=1 Tax=Symbiodinium pilosum TaxID=2952 RepID=A0A812KDS6_SYMPI|nr:aqdA1 [Symbiodinium pilosum]